MIEGPRSQDGGRVDVANEMDEECCWSTECGRGRGCEAPKVTDIGEVKCGNEGIATPGAPLDDDGCSDKISSILSTLRVKSTIIS